MWEKGALMKMLNLLVMQGYAYVPQDEGIRYKEITTADGRETTVCKLRFRHTTGAKAEDADYAPADFYEVEVWGKTAEYIIANVKNGDSIQFSGYVRTDKYKTKEGENRTRIVFVANDFWRTGTTPKAKESAADDDGWSSTVTTKPAAAPKAEAPAAAPKEEMPNVFAPKAKPSTRKPAPYGDRGGYMSGATNVSLD